MRDPDRSSRRLGERLKRSRCCCEKVGMLYSSNTADNYLSYCVSKQFEISIDKANNTANLSELELGRTQVGPNTTGAV